MSLFESLADCTFPLLSTGEGYSIFIALFIAGFMGSFMHCAFMCGPFVLSQTSKNFQNTPASQMTELTRLKGAALLPYHLGRLTTYVFLGAVVTMLSHYIVYLWQPISSLLLLLAGLLMIASVFKFKAPRFTPAIIPLFFEKIKSYAKPFFDSPKGVNGYLLGMILGFIPCGLLYAALASVAATGSPTLGVVGMAVFAVSTIPALFLVGVLSSLSMTALKQKTRVFAKFSTVSAGLWLCFIAIKPAIFN